MNVLALAFSHANGRRTVGHGRVFSVFMSCWTSELHRMALGAEEAISPQEVGFDKSCLELGQGGVVSGSGDVGRGRRHVEPPPVPPSLLEEPVSARSKKYDALQVPSELGLPLRVKVVVGSAEARFVSSPPNDAGQHAQIFDDQADIWAREEQENAIPGPTVDNLLSAVSKCILCATENCALLTAFPFHQDAQDTRHPARLYLGKPDQPGSVAAIFDIFVSSHSYHYW